MLSGKNVIMTMKGTNTHRRIIVHEICRQNFTFFTVYR